MSLVYARNSGTLQAMGGSVNLGDIVKSFMSPGYDGYVNSLNGLDGNIDLISSDDSLIIDKTGGTAIDASGNAIDASGNRVLNLRVNGLSQLQGQFVENAVGVVGGSNDIPSSSTSLWALAKQANSLIPIQEFGSSIASALLTGSFVTVRTATLTTTINSTPILAWGSITVQETGGGGGGGGNSATIEYRLNINGVNSDTHTAIIPHNGQSVLPVFFQGTGATLAGNTNIILQARVTSGVATRTATSLMALGNPLSA